MSPPLKGAEELQRWSVSPYRTLHLAMPVVLLGISFLFWFLWGRDPKPGTIIPRFSPPQGVEAGFARYVRTMAVDDHCFAAMVLGLAVKGALTIEENAPLSSSIASENALAGKALSLLSRVMGKQYRLRIRSDRIANLSLTAEEQLLLTFLFVSGKGELLLSGDNRLIIQETFTQLKKRFVERAKPLFSANLGKWALSVALFEIYAVGLFILMIVDASKGGIARVEPLVAMLTGPFFLLPLSLPIPPGKGNWGTRFFLRILFPGIFLFVLIGATFAGGASGLAADPVSAPAPLLCAAILLLFKPLMKVRSDSGARLAEELEGLRLYMATAETPRMEQMTPPQETPELFEALLPYSLRAGHGENWANRFEKNARGGALFPSWYRGDAYTLRDRRGNRFVFVGFRRGCRVGDTFLRQQWQRLLRRRWRRRRRTGMVEEEKVPPWSVPHVLVRRRAIKTRSRRRQGFTHFREGNIPPRPREVVACSCTHSDRNGLREGYTTKTRGKARKPRVHFEKEEGEPQCCESFGGQGVLSEEFFCCFSSLRVVFLRRATRRREKRWRTCVPGRWGRNSRESGSISGVNLRRRGRSSASSPTTWTQASCS